MNITDLVLSNVAGFIVYSTCILSLFGTINVLEEVVSIILSMIFGFLASAITVLSINGFLPFIHGFYPPIWIIAVICLVCTIPFIDRIEIFGNIIIDAVFCGVLSAFIILFSAAGLSELVSGGIQIIWLKVWIILSLVVAIITISVVKIYNYV